MRAAVMERHGGPEALVVRDDVDEPSPGAGQVLVGVRAAGVNNTDIWTREGAYGSPADPDAVAGWLGAPVDTPRIQGADIAGVVQQVGPVVDEGWVGRRVLVDPAFYADASPDADVIALLGSERDGGFAEAVVVDAAQVHDVSGSPLTDAQLACLPIAYGTAAGMLARGRAADGECVVVTGASGGVGVALVQLAAAAGLRVVALSTRDKAERLIELGADAVVDRHSSTLTDDLAAAAPNGIDLVADVVGGETFSIWPGVVSRRGRIVVAGAIAGPVVTLDLRPLYLQQRQIIGSTMHTRRDFGALVERARRGEVSPPVAARFGLEQIHAAQQAMRRGSSLGKVVIDLTRVPGTTPGT
ncbi:MAG: zinc-binding dehydrogenase [Jiangellales bacterium]